MIAWLLVLLAGCADDPCGPMCDEVALRTEICLAGDGLDWEAAGYLDRADFVDSCDTWAWEQRLLARDAGEPRESVTATCEAHQRVAETGSCDDLAALEW